MRMQYSMKFPKDFFLSILILQNYIKRKKCMWKLLSVEKEYSNGNKKFLKRFYTNFFNP